MCLIAGEAEGISMSAKGHLRAHLGQVTAGTALLMTCPSPASPPCAQPSERHRPQYPDNIPLTFKGLVSPGAEDSIVDQWP